MFLPSRGAHGHQVDDTHLSPVVIAMVSAFLPLLPRTPALRSCLVSSGGPLRIC